MISAGYETTGAVSAASRLATERRARPDVLFMLSQKQVRHIWPYFPAIRGTPRVDDLKVVSGIIHVIASRLPWSAIPDEYGPQTTVYCRFVRWRRLGVLDRILSILAQDLELGSTIERAQQNLGGRTPVAGKRRRVGKMMIR